ncbi:FAD/NAD(P)-binding protein [Desulfovibrio ferrophilus]|uniref:Oxidoreductase FAD/NAD(P)-binding domain-containing protein n=1 Tax=Desulfovibrio ferrophilus TaxID=241368 RepID=A0A2Z6AWD1_9BACT|nr:FAD/NAD(P)-binding protein [Desulfovibrio ferrophilus]BBD07486.1 oxidoreductase FAD/NAD(P)-binding domain-containing protein [Desulfovibrio ferrophilus]
MTELPNPYLPEPATIIEVLDETPNIKTFRVVLDDEQKMRDFSFDPGQVGQMTAYGAGEATFVINSPSTRMDYLQFSVMRTGEVTEALHGLRAGDKVGLRAPLGNSFPLAALKGKDVVIVGGGIGMAPLRTLLLTMLDNRADYGSITVLYGARSPEDLSYRYEFDEWTGGGADLTLTVDAEASGWEHRVGLIPHVLKDLAPSASNAVAVTCGPPIMIKFTVQALEELGFTDEAIITTLERRMKCGVGLCGRCNIGPKYVCVDGPVFTWAELKELPAEL